MPADEKRLRLLFVSGKTNFVKEEFEAVLITGHKCDAVEVPFDPAISWRISPQKVRPGRNGYPVKVTIDGAVFEGAVVPRMKRFYLEITADAKAAAGISTGDRIRVAVEPLADR